MRPLYHILGLLPRNIWQQSDDTCLPCARKSPVTFYAFLMPTDIISVAPGMCSGSMQDDMELAPDLFTYFEALAPLLDQDDMLMCISSWNDHGQV